MEKKQEVITMLQTVLEREMKRVYRNLPYNSKNCYHHFLQAHVNNIAEKFHLQGRKEYRIRDLLEYEGRNGFIDVCWLQNEKPIVCMEVESGLRKKSVFKLKQVEATYTFYLYYGTRTKEEIETFRNEYDSAGSIIWIHMPLIFQKNKDLGIVKEDYLKLLVKG